MEHVKLGTYFGLSFFLPNAPDRFFPYKIEAYLTTLAPPDHTNNYLSDCKK